MSDIQAEQSLLIWL